MSGLYSAVTREMLNIQWCVSKLDEFPYWSFITFSVLSQDIRNTVGNIPMEWYKDYPHIGYDLDGKKIFKPIRNKDELDEFLDKMENPDYWWGASGTSI